MSRSDGSTRLAIVLSIAVAAAVAGAIVIIDPPTQRQRRLDERRIAELELIRDEVNTYWKRHQAIPSDLAGLAAEPGFTAPTVDPESGASYGYEIEDIDSYRLCASFALNSSARRYARYGSDLSQWAHPAGRFCFNLDVDKPETKVHD